MAAVPAAIVVGFALKVPPCGALDVRLVTPETAAVSLKVSWHRLATSEISTSVVSQKWTSTGDGWKLTVEGRSGGAPGLFAAPPPELESKKANDGPSTLTGQL